MQRGSDFKIRKVRDGQSRFKSRMQQDESTSAYGGGAGSTLEGRQDKGRLSGLPRRSTNALSTVPREPSETEMANHRRSKTGQHMMKSFMQNPGTFLS